MALFSLQLVAANPSKRPNPRDRLEAMRRSGGYFKNALVDALLFLEEVHLKDEAEKSRFYSSLPALIDDLPPHVGAYKVLPALLSAQELGSAGAGSILTSALKLGAGLTSEEYAATLVPAIVRMFASNDRNARFKLLSQIETFAPHLGEKTVNEEILPHVLTGFLDQEPMIREKTVISMIHLAPKLSRDNLDENVVMKHFSRLLRDEQAGIRTNTTVCLGKIARFLHYQTRQKVLIAAFATKLRDPFPPARIAAINALAATQQYHTLADTANRVLPALCPLLMDPEEPVRKQAFKVFKGFSEKMERVSDDPSLKEEMECEVTAASAGANQTSAAASGWAAWAVGAIQAKFYKSAPQPQSQPQPTAVNEINGAARASEPTAKDDNVGKLSSELSSLDVKVIRREARHLHDVIFQAPASTTSRGDGWENDDQDDDTEDWGALAEPEPEPAPAAAWTKAPVVAQQGKNEDFWESFESAEEQARKKEEERKAREEKRAQRRAEMAAKREARKGPMKLGAKTD